MIKAVAVDDESPSLEIIKDFCERIPGLSLEKTFNKPTLALQYLKQFPTDILFLDINMPALNGLEFSKILTQKINIIFTTAYSEYAVEGFNLNAVDYLLKPFTFQRFQQAIDKAMLFIKNTETNASSFITLRINYGLVNISTDSILFIEGLDDYLKIHLSDQKPVVVRMTMKAMLEKLPADKFIRVHRSFIIPLSKISSIRNKIIHIGSEEIPLGNSYEEDFLKAFKK
ncbi:MAG TPA: LytTR family DNA-binding domain-containing protein [Parafilimonas sp.]|nr:LytTR family DNA-binding domain-containing protein [Parafilimonas sp.]